MKKRVILQELRAYLDHYLTAASFVDYCPNGLQVEGKREIGKIATAVSLSFDVIERCIAKKIDALIVHHGLFWKGDSFAITDTKRKKLKLLLENEISLFGYHLPLDAHIACGNNWKAARDLGWRDLKAFGEIGVMGRCSAISLDAFIKKLEKYYRHQAVVVAGGKYKIESVALVSGGAYKELGKAAELGVDAFITGNFDEPAFWIAQEEKIHFLALGHFATERVGPIALAEHLKKRFLLPVDFLDSDNPF